MSHEEERRTGKLDTKRIREMAAFIANEKRRRKEQPGAVLTGTVPGLCDEVDYLRNLLEQRTAALTRTIDAKNTAEDALGTLRHDLAYAEQRARDIEDRAETAEARVARVERYAAWLETLADGDKHYARGIRAALDEGQS